MVELEKIRAFFQKDGFAQCARIDIQDVTEEGAICTLDLKDQHYNAGGAVHGGVIFTLADFAFAVAANSLGKLTVSLNNNITFVKPGRGKWLKAVARKVSYGRTTCLYEVIITDDEENIIAHTMVNGYIKDTLNHF